MQPGQMTTGLLCSVWTDASLASTSIAAKVDLSDWFDTSDEATALLVVWLMM